MISTFTSTSNEYRRIGPPGTGKTTWLCRQVAAAIESACREFSEDPAECRAVLVSTLTRSAANELRSRGLVIPRECIGTLHSHAFRALGKPKLCVDDKDLAEWNKVCKPNHRLTGAGADAPDKGRSSRKDAPGNKRLESYLNNRARCLDRQLWSAQVTEFAEEYETWKRTAGVRDFSDVIHDALATIPIAPGNPRFIFVDEAQDHDLSELRLVRAWAANCEKVVIVGDPDQNLYEWRGSDPGAFFAAEIPPENTRVLSQSYRVPRAVHAAAVAMIHRCSDESGHGHAEYLPRDADGECRRIAVAPCAKGGEDDACDLFDRIRAKDPGGTIMLLAACEYLVYPLVHELKERGIPFHNPFAPERGLFNPLNPASGRGMADRLLAYLRPDEATWGSHARMWNATEFRDWTDALDGRDFLRVGAKKAIDKLAGSSDADQPLSMPTLRGLLRDDGDKTLHELSALDLDFFQSRLVKSKQSTGNYAVRVLRKHGAAALKEPPKLIIGTVHSVKGGEASTVVLCPDLSPSGYDQLDGGNADAIYRLFYVGMTRARHTLLLCEPASNRSIEW